MRVALVGADLGLHKLLEFSHNLQIHLFEVVALKADELDVFFELPFLHALAAHLLSHRRELGYVALDLGLPFVLHAAQQVRLQLFYFPIQYPLLLLLYQPQLLPLLLQLLLQLPVNGLQLAVIILEDSDFLVENS